MHPGVWVPSPHSGHKRWYDIAAGIVLSAPGFIITQPRLQESDLLLVVICQGLDTGQKSVSSLALSLLAQWFKETQPIV